MNFIRHWKSGLRNSQAAFTLIELLLYTALASVIIGTVAAFYGTLLTARIKNETINEVEQHGQQVLTAITHAVRNAEGITSPSAGSSGGTLVLDAYDSGDDPTTFDIASGVIRVCEGGGCSAVDLTGSKVTASSVSFSNVSSSGSPGAVRVQFTLDSASPSVRQEYQYEKTFYATAALRQP